jgi:hypothetical protein
MNLAKVQKALGHGSITSSMRYVFCKLAQARRECFFRRIEYCDEENEQLLVFLTNHRTLAAATIVLVHVGWAIEAFFRALKQSLRVQTFGGTSEKALPLQIWTALIAMLLIKCWHLVARLRQPLFVYRDLVDLIDNPFQPPPAVTPALEPFFLGLD